MDKGIEGCPGPTPGGGAKESKKSHTGNFSPIWGEAQIGYCTD